MKKTKLLQGGFLHLHSLIPLVVVVVAIGAVGSYVLKKSQAAKPASTATGTIWVTSSGSLSTPFAVEFSYTKSAKQLKRPFIQYDCYRDIDGDGKINSTPFSNSVDLVYSNQTYLLDSYTHPDYPVKITSSGTAGLAGTASANLLSGSSKLVSEKGVAQCSASLQEWGTNLRQETYPIIYQTTPLINLQDPRLNQ